MLETIEDFHRRMVAIATRAGHNLQSPSEAGIAELGRSRLEMARLLTIYNLFVHRSLFEPIIATGTPAEVAAVKAIKAECVMVTYEFADYSRKWLRVDVTERWSDYQPQGLALRHRIERHLNEVMAIARRHGLAGASTDRAAA